MTLSAPDQLLKAVEMKKAAWGGSFKKRTEN
jgi:hypothetical protein